MPNEQASLFQDPSESVPTKNCVRCNIRCRATTKVNPNAQLFVIGDMKTGKYCANCLVVDFFKNFDLGPSSSMGKWYFDPTIPIPEYMQDDPEENKKRFNPASFREPHIQRQFLAILAVGQKEYGAELRPEDIDWDEVIANWHLPFPEPPTRGRRKKK